MSEIRLIKLAKYYNVGIGTLIEFLNTIGAGLTDMNPYVKVSDCFIPDLDERFGGSLDSTRVHADNKATIDRHKEEQKLKEIFGIDHFYDEQWVAVSRIMSGERILMIQKTGFGKSLCFQYPATQFPGITVVFSPLIALMRDQVRALVAKGIPAAYINSEQSKEENDEVLAKALNNELKILYIAPERQEDDDWVEATMQMNLSMIVIDEAHTISTWGHDFRPAFSRIINLVRLLPSSLPVLATTATATKRVQKDIEEQIGGTLTTIRGSLVRDNFSLYVIRVKSEDEKMIWLAKNLSSLPGTGLIYTGTRISTETYAKWLKYVGIDAVDYNAGLDAETRKNVEEGLMNNKWKCIVSTNALGMGIDKPDIRFVIHTQIPVSPIHYYQEIGRSGRDGKPTQIILFYNDTVEQQTAGFETKSIETDAKLPTSFIENAKPGQDKYVRVINALKDDLLSERELLKKTNLTSGQLRTIKYDLIDQGIIKEVKYGKVKQYEYQFGAPEFRYDIYEPLKANKFKELDSMIAYVKTKEPRMKYLCSFLDSDTEANYQNCDNTNLENKYFQDDQELRSKLKDFYESYFPELELCESSFGFLNMCSEDMIRFSVKIPYPKVIDVYKNSELIKSYSRTVIKADFTNEEYAKVSEILKKHRENKSHITNGVAASYYGISNVGNAIHRSKYENGGDFPDFLVKLMLKSFGKKFGRYKYDYVLYVPPTKSGDLVKHLAEKFAWTINVPVLHDLKKVKVTEEQKMFQNSYAKQENVKNAFDINVDVNGKSIILVDDIYDSGATIKEISRMLSEKGAEYVTPVVLAKTVGGTPQ